VRASVQVYVSRAALRVLLDSDPSDRLLRSRIAAIEKLRDDLNKLAPWPALTQSLTEDADRLRLRLLDGVGRSK
jgi:hypothetical protein